MLHMYHSAQNMRRVVHIENIKTWGFREVGLFIETLEKEGGKNFHLSDMYVFQLIKRGLYTGIFP